MTKLIPADQTPPDQPVYGRWAAGGEYESDFDGEQEYFAAAPIEETLVAAGDDRLNWQQNSACSFFVRGGVQSGQAMTAWIARQLLIKQCEGRGKDCRFEARGAVAPEGTMPYSKCAVTFVEGPGARHRHAVPIAGDPPPLLARADIDAAAVREEGEKKKAAELASAAARMAAADAAARYAPPPTIAAPQTTVGGAVHRDAYAAQMDEVNAMPSAIRAREKRAIMEAAVRKRDAEREGASAGADPAAEGGDANGAASRRRLAAASSTPAPSTSTAGVDAAAPAAEQRGPGRLHDAGRYANSLEQLEKCVAAAQAQFADGEPDPSRAHAVASVRTKACAASLGLRPPPLDHRRWIVILRDPRAACVSKYRQLVRTGEVDGDAVSVQEWTLRNIETVAGWTAFRHFWHTRVMRPEQTLMLDYRDLHHSLRQVSQKIRGFIGMKSGGRMGGVEMERDLLRPETLKEWLPEQPDVGTMGEGNPELPDDDDAVIAGTVRGAGSLPNSIGKTLGAGTLSKVDEACRRILPASLWERWDKQEKEAVANEGKKQYVSPEQEIMNALIERKKRRQNNYVNSRKREDIAKYVKALSHTKGTLDKDTAAKIAAEQKMAKLGIGSGFMESVGERDTHRLYPQGGGETQTLTKV
jgi:hypothetical protein